MAKLKVIYDSHDECDQIVKLVEKHVNMEQHIDDAQLYATIKELFQHAFNEGRKFEKHINNNSPSRDSIVQKLEIE